MSKNPRDRLVGKRLLEQGFVALAAQHASSCVWPPSLCPIPDLWTEREGKKTRRLSTLEYQEPPPKDAAYRSDREMGREVRSPRRSPKITRIFGSQFLSLIMSCRRGQSCGPMSCGTDEIGARNRPSSATRISNPVLICTRCSMGQLKDMYRACAEWFVRLRVAIYIWQEITSQSSSKILLLYRKERMRHHIA